MFSSGRLFIVKLGKPNDRCVFCGNSFKRVTCSSISILRARLSDFIWRLLPIFGDINFCAFELKHNFSSDHRRGLVELIFWNFRWPLKGSCSLIRNVSMA